MLKNLDISEVSIHGADQKDRGLWEREWNVLRRITVLKYIKERKVIVYNRPCQEIGLYHVSAALLKFSTQLHQPCNFTFHVNTEAWLNVTEL